MTYEYSDDFVVNSIGVDELSGYEAQALEEVSKYGITDEFFKKELTICRTYMLAARAQIEADGMAEKYKTYREEFDRYLKQALLAASNNVPAAGTIKTMKVARG